MTGKEPEPKPINPMWLGARMEQRGTMVFRPVGGVQVEIKSPADLVTQGISGVSPDAMQYHWGSNAPEIYNQARIAAMGSSEKPATTTR